MTERALLTQWLDLQLEPQRFKDYGPNGLQVEGCKTIERLVTGVTASQALIDAALHDQADAILVHHGLFWRGDDGRITGWKKQRLARLLSQDVNLYAYHLPLDAHPAWGNNVQLGRKLGWTSVARFGEQELGCIADVDYDHVGALQQHLERTLGRSATVVSPATRRPVRRVAWCTGGAQGYFEAAIAAGVDAFITGEISEPQTHLARECGVAYLACGHHATERYGVQALGEQAALALGLTHRFIDIDNPA